MKYKIIYADPPWSYNDKNCSGACETHYKTLSISDLCKLNVNAISENDSVLFLWATYPLIKEALSLGESWGFKYKTIAFQWIKINKKGFGKFFGLGRWTRGNTEPCLLFTKGKPQRIANNVFQIVERPISSHSRKPDEVRNRIVQLMGDLPRIELFAREKKEGWDAIGNEIDGRDIKEILGVKI